MTGTDSDTPDWTLVIDATAMPTASMAVRRPVRPGAATPATLTPLGLSGPFSPMGECSNFGQRQSDLLQILQPAGGPALPFRRQSNQTVRIRLQRRQIHLSHQTADLMEPLRVSKGFRQQQLAAVGGKQPLAESAGLIAKRRQARASGLFHFLRRRPGRRLAHAHGLSQPLHEWHRNMAGLSGARLK